MSNNENFIWQDISGTHPDLDFSDWAVMENIFGEFGEPGFAQFIRPMNMPHMTGIEGPVDATWTVYRGENGALLGAHARHVVDGAQKPIFIMVHPDHQRQGIGSMIGDYVISKYEEERGEQFAYNTIWGTLPADFITPPIANFINKYAKNINLDKTEEQPQ